MTVVLDDSALLAYLLDEPGAEVVDGLLAARSIGLAQALVTGDQAFLLSYATQFSIGRPG
jgi:PIN domain nuclease of toxin-antitoxin system